MFDGCSNAYLAEKIAVLSGERKLMLNQRSKIVSKCLHTKKFKLKIIRLNGAM